MYIDNLRFNINNEARKITRLLAYSGIPHAGMLLLFTVLDFSIAKDFIIIYITFYSVANICLYISLNSLKISSDLNNTKQFKKNFQR